jgi:hypothetical protein
MSLILRWLMLLLGWGVAVSAAEERIEVGVLALDVNISRTAVLFHVVDQLSEWSYFSHRQYGRAFAPLSDADRAMLEKHKTVRAKHSWGEGLEQTFYSPLALDEALANGIAQGWLSAQEAVAEREVLLHFAPRIEALLTAQSASLVAFREKLRRELAARSQLIAQFARFTGTSPDLVAVYLIPDPDANSIGGGYNGGRLTVEVPTAADAIPTTLHELFHVFLKTKEAEIEAAVAGIPGLDSETLNEGLAYAFSPGLVHRGSATADPLASNVRQEFAAGKPLSDKFTGYNRFALSLRPLLQAALADERQTLGTFLPRAVDVWRALWEVEKARDGIQPSELRTVTIIRLYRRNAPELPDFVKQGNPQQPTATEYFVACKEWVEGTYRQMSQFYGRAGHEVVFTAARHPDVKGHLNGHTVCSGDGTFQAYGLQIAAEDRDKIVPGVAYGMKPINTNDTYRWQVSADLAPVKLLD